MATIAEASECPKCGYTGEVGPRKRTAKPGITASVCTCKNETCRWFNTGWVIQFNPDGSIPDARERDESDREPRRFPAVNNLLFNQRREAIMGQADRINGTDGGEVQH